jgi:hypothetical protein
MMMLSRITTAACSRRLARSSRRALSSASAGEKKFYDPQAEAMQRMNENMGKMSGIEAVNALPAKIHYANFATAAGLVGFVGYVFWYSMTAVGQVTNSEDSTLASLQNEAQDARVAKEKAAAQERTAEELAELDMGVNAKDMEQQGITLAVAAPDAIATQEEDRNKAVLNKGEKRRSFVNQVVFFWR